MSDLKQAIDELRASPHYKKLATYEPPFNPFEIVGATHRELIHSSVLAWLLRDEANKEFRQRFATWIRNRIVAEAEKTKEDLIKLQELREESVAPENPKNSSFKVTEEVEKAKEQFTKLQRLLEGFNPEDSPLKPKKIKAEYSFEAGADFDAGRIDVFAHFKSLESLELVIGIEVKVNAGEGLEQVEKYQKFLCQEYPDHYKKVIVFLTPEGYSSKTKSSGTGVLVLEMPWSDIALMIGGMRATLGNENDFRMQFSQHLEKHLTVNETEGQRIVRELLSEDSNLEIIKEVTSKMETWDDKKEIEGKIDGFSVEMVQKIIDDLFSLQASLECEFWRALREQLQLQDKELEFQLYQSDGSTEVIEDEKLDKRVKEYIEWGYGGSSPGLTFRIPGSSLDDDHEVVCRITYDAAPTISHLYYAFVLCKKEKDNIGERVSVSNGDENHEKYLDLYRDLLEGKILNYGPEEKNIWHVANKDREHGWLGWKQCANENIYFANKPALFDTLVKIKEHEDNKVVNKLVDEICAVVKKISEETTRKRRTD